MDPAEQEEAGARAVLEIVRTSLAGSVADVARAASQLPASEDFFFYSNSRNFKDRVRGLQQQAATILQKFPDADTWPSGGADADEGESASDWLVSLQDSLLEGVDRALEEAQARQRSRTAGSSSQLAARDSLARGAAGGGAGRAGEGAAGGGILGSSPVQGSQQKVNAVQTHVASLPRPQEKFSPPVDNSNTPFLPHPHIGGNRLAAPAATAGSLTSGGGGADGADNRARQVDAYARKLGYQEEYCHPLEVSLRSLQYTRWQLEATAPQLPRALDATPFTLVETERQLVSMAADLARAREIAVDLENHSFRSFQGFVCVMQVSTRAADYVVDALALRRHIGPALGPLFADPSRVKVLHGSDRDILWLQRDFGIYVANLFDTGQAARVLQMSGFGLAHLLKHFCDVNADKRYQLADWRMRPLPADMLKYAREDTHYLLYIYDFLKKELLAGDRNLPPGEPSLLLQVLNRSRDLCLQKYEKDLLVDTSYLKFYESQRRNLRPVQLAVLEGLYKWRDAVARERDESVGYVMPNHLLMKIAERMPPDVKSLHKILRGASPSVARSAADVVDIIAQSQSRAVVPALPDVSEAQPHEVAVPGDQAAHAAATTTLPESADPHPTGGGGEDLESEPVVLPGGTRASAHLSAVGTTAASLVQADEIAGAVGDGGRGGGGGLTFERHLASQEGDKCVGGASVPAAVTAGFLDERQVALPASCLGPPVGPTLTARQPPPPASPKDPGSHVVLRPTSAPSSGAPGSPESGVPGGMAERQAGPHGSSDATTATASAGQLASDLGSQQRWEKTRKPPAGVRASAPPPPPRRRSGLASMLAPPSHRPRPSSAVAPPAAASMDHAASVAQRVKESLTLPFSLTAPAGQLAPPAEPQGLGGRQVAGAVGHSSVGAGGGEAGAGDALLPAEVAGAEVAGAEVAVATSRWEDIVSMDSALGTAGGGAGRGAGGGEAVFDGKGSAEKRREGGADWTAHQSWEGASHSRTPGGSGKGVAQVASPEKAIPSNDDAPMPLSLAEMHRQERRKRKQQGSPATAAPGGGSLGAAAVPAGVEGELGSVSAHLSGPPPVLRNTQGGAGAASQGAAGAPAGSVPAFDYASARARLQLDDVGGAGGGAQKRQKKTNIGEMLGGGGRRERPNHSTKTPPGGGASEKDLRPGEAGWHFDPLKHAEEESILSMKGGKRSQVYPRSGNRSATFRK